MKKITIQSDGFVAATFVLAATLCILLPRYRDISLWGSRFDVGWPVPAASLKVGQIVVGEPDALHIQGLPWLLVNVALWAGAYFCMRRAIRAGVVSRPTMLILITIGLLISVAYFCVGGLRLAEDLHASGIL